ncbi:MAG: hypothetical protein P4L64_11840 [Caulobacteraceae bacterium]|nr:hypothetical protein [Caulobacteraceae bacterium]
MTILVCPLEAVERLVRERGPSHVISLLSPGAAPPVLPPGPVRLHLAFNDIAAPQEGLIHPDADHVQALLAFARTWDRAAPLLVHCWAGVSRSTAGGYILACLRDGAGAEAALAQRLRGAAPYATPNPLLVALGDEALDRRGAMVRAIAAIGRGADTAFGAPFAF